MSPESRRRSRWSGAVGGLVLATVGVLFLLDQLEILGFDELIGYWPLALVAIGVGHFLDRSFFAGTTWFLLGVWFLAWTLDYIDFGPFDGWALVPILIGVNLIRLPFRRGRVTSRESSYTAFQAGMGARIRGVPPDDLSATAIMGGIELDFTGAEPEPSGSVVLSATVMWAGIEITVPSGWTVENRVLPILAGVEEKGPNLPDGSGRLILEGVAIMAGIEVKYS